MHKHSIIDEKFSRRFNKCSTHCNIAISNVSISLVDALLFCCSMISKKTDFNESNLLFFF
jgi:hypothetical protein